MPLRALARVNLAAIERNCRALSAAAGGAELCAVVKAEGYGHGAADSARAALAGGARWLAVATAAEARDLRAAGIGARLMVLGAVSPEELGDALAADADLVAWTEAFADAAAGARLHVKLDTGLGRLGTRDAGLATRLARREGVVGLMTHFATADEPGDRFLGEQLARFAEWVAPLKAARPELVVHAANSAATLREPAAHFDLVRCGIATYGLDPFHEDPFARGLEPALALESYAAAVKPCAPGESAGYGRRFVASSPTTLATLPIGYGDGVRRGLTNNADVLVGGRRRPLVGTVSMDNVTVDLGPDAPERAGAPAVLIGEQGGERILAEEVARRLDTINYEVTCGITGRVTREYHRDGEPA
ncbi:MAG TPA: alanine racemase [Solirubrobacteraceae bacterium]|jgi:alanine racemase|nr:alanine racemase [Solirubrobacteraceae bacterium]